MRVVSLAFRSLLLAIAVVVVIGLSSTPLSVAQEATPDAGAECPVTALEQNLALIPAYIES